MTYEPWSVVAVPFPFIDRRQAKRRPALVLSPIGFQKAHDCAVLAMITDARNPAWPSDVAIADIVAAGLRFASVVRCKLFTLESQIIVGRVGALARADQAAVRRALRTALIR